MSARPLVSNFKDFDLQFDMNSITKDVKPKSGISSISQSIKNILLTSPGERPFSQFGVGLNYYFFENDTLETLIAVREMITSMIGQYEPRVVVDYNDIEVVRDGPGSIRINIRYRLANDLGLANAQNLSIVLTED